MVWLIAASKTESIYPFQVKTSCFLREPKVLRLTQHAILKGTPGLTKKVTVVLAVFVTSSQIPLKNRWFSPFPVMAFFLLWTKCHAAWEKEPRPHRMQENPIN
jgi:hypothetical protein